jgi:hypothetical protein
MILKDGLLTMYHGSYTAIKNIDLSMCNRYRDFGRGYYTTTNKDQAKRFVRNSILKAGVKTKK